MDSQRQEYEQATAGVKREDDGGLDWRRIFGDAEETFIQMEPPMWCPHMSTTRNNLVCTFKILFFYLDRRTGWCV
jgi:hypothetical protein